MGARRGRCGRARTPASSCSGATTGRSPRTRGAIACWECDVDGILVLVIEHIWADAREPIEPMAQAVIDSVRFESSSGSPAPAAFSSSGCPVDDADACDRLAMAARALTQADATALAGLSRPDRFECDDVPAEIFPACAEGGVLRGHARRVVGAGLRGAGAGRLPVAARGDPRQRRSLVHRRPWNRVDRGPRRRDVRSGGAPPAAPITSA